MSSSPAVLVIGASGAIGSPLINDLGPDHCVGGLRLVSPRRPSTRRMGRSRVRNYFERIGNGS